MNSTENNWHESPTITGRLSWHSRDGEFIIYHLENGAYELTTTDENCELVSLGQFPTLNAAKPA